MHDAWLNSIPLDAAAVKAVGPHLFSAVPSEQRSASYDSKAARYDATLKYALYHRIVWGSSPQSYTQFGREALEAAEGGHFAEVGGGSLLFTGHLYRTTRNTSITIVDRSLVMLRRGLPRIDSGRGVPDAVVALQADAAALPVRPGVFKSVLCLSLLHVPCDRQAIVEAIGRSLTPGSGRLFVSALVHSGRWSDAYMSVLYRAGELGPPMTLPELVKLVSGRWGRVDSQRVEGNMAFVVVRHKS